jgi:hypothetical protein
MTSKALKFISDSLASIGIRYSFMEWKSIPAYPYFVGEYQETEPMNEDGMHEASFILTGFSKNSWLKLEEAKEAIERLFNTITGKTAIFEDGSGIAVFYTNSFPVREENAAIKRIQINLSVKEWRVN